MFKILLYNPLAGNNCNDFTELYNQFNEEEIIKTNINKINNLNYFFSIFNKEDIILCGGDGTLNYLVNHIDINKINNKLFYYKGGTGNDFYRDINTNNNQIIEITNYLRNLPNVEINGNKHLFINNVAFGLDGYCCKISDIKKREGKKINYTKIAINGLIYDYKPTSMIAIVDGNKYHFSNVWLAPTMNGKYMGGGMMIAPNQDRMNDYLSLVVIHCNNRLKLLTLMPKLFDGTIQNIKNEVNIIKGNDIYVKYIDNKDIQIDGEVIPNVSSYHAKKLIRK